MAKAEAATAASETATKAKEAKAIETQKAKAAGGSKRGTDTAKQQVHDGKLPQNLDDWELYEGGLPEGSTLLGGKALLDEYPEDEANSKKTKKTNTGKGKRVTPRLMNDEGHKTIGAR